jgi:hypothetical protein
MTIFFVICGVVITLCVLAQTLFMYGIVNNLRLIREERLLVQKLVSNERWI